LLGLALTAACGGGGDDGPDATDGSDGSQQNDGADGQPGDGGGDDGSDGSPLPPDDGEEVTTQSVTVFETSRAGAALDDKGPQKVFTGATPLATRIVIDTAEERQQILGFGGAITESSATVLAELDEAERQKVIDAYFSPEGANYTIARTHIASCDFSVASYQYSTQVDVNVSDFSVAHDEAELIPLIKDAVTASKGALKVVSAAWSAPAWMKSPAELFIRPAASNNYQGVDPVLQPQYYGAYALYLTKYLKAYAERGIDVWGLSPQNEPFGTGGNWETMRWSGAAMRDFIRDHLGPALAKEGLDTKLMIFDHNKEPASGEALDFVRTILNDPDTAKYVWGTALHWYNSTVDPFPATPDAIHEIDPTRPILGTEHTIDGLTDQKAAPASAGYQYSWLTDDFYWRKDAYDWGYWWLAPPARDQHPVYEPVYRYARDIIVGLNHWYAGWIDWNAVLDKDGGPNHANNFCAAPVMVDTQSSDVYYSPLFYVMKHFSKFIRPDALVLESEVTLANGVSLSGYDGMATEGLLATAARNPDGSFAVVLFNQTAQAIDYDLAVGESHAQGTIAAQALQTVVWKSN
jgi:glucosylceramidase